MHARRLAGCLFGLVVVTAACRKTASTGAPAIGGDAAVVAVDALGADAVGATVTIDAAPNPAPVTAAGRFAVARAVDDDSFVDVYQIVDGKVAKVSTLKLPRPRLAPQQLVWSTVDSPIVFHGVDLDADRGDVLATIVGDGYTPVVGAGRGDLLRFVTSATGEVWVERCTTWDENADEEGCRVRGYDRVTPKPGKARKRPAPRPWQATAPAPATTILTARKHPTADGQFVLGCTHDGKSTTLYQDDQLHEAPTWHWLSAEPPIALVRVAFAGMGGGDDEVDDASQLLVRGCASDEDERGFVLGPAGLWAEPGADREWIVRWRGVELAVIAGDAIGFAGGIPAGTRP